MLKIQNVYKGDNFDKNKKKETILITGKIKIVQTCFP